MDGVSRILDRLGMSVKRKSEYREDLVGFLCHACSLRLGFTKSNLERDGEVEEKEEETGDGSQEQLIAPLSLPLLQKPYKFLVLYVSASYRYSCPSKSKW